VTPQHQRRQSHDVEDIKTKSPNDNTTAKKHKQI
jgi:serine/threonine protein kinase